MEGQEWVKKDSLEPGRAKAGASSLSEDGSMMVTGGINDVFLASVEMYEHGHWSSGEPLPEKKVNHCQIRTGSRIYVIGKMIKA